MVQSANRIIFLLLLLSTHFMFVLKAQDNTEVCCDPDMVGYDAGICLGPAAEFDSSENCVNEEPNDCVNGFLDPAACIPIDGGLSLLALAGGGLATAAMRRRREEEEAAAQGAA